MKTIQLAYVCFSLFLLSCGSDRKSPETAGAPGDKSISARAQKNLDAVHVVDKAFETGDVSGIDSVLASGFIDHTDKGPKNGDSLKAMIKMTHAADKTMKMETVKELADDDYVFALMHYTGTGDGVMMPAGPYDMHAIEVVKFNADSKATEHWGYMEMGEVSKMMQMMGSMDKMKTMEKDKKK